MRQMSFGASGRGWDGCVWTSRLPGTPSSPGPSSSSSPSLSPSSPTSSSPAPPATPATSAPTTRWCSSLSPSSPPSPSAASPASSRSTAFAGSSSSTSSATRARRSGRDTWPNSMYVYTWNMDYGWFIFFSSSTSTPSPPLSLICCIFFKKILLWIHGFKTPRWIKLILFLCISRRTQLRLYVVLLHPPPFLSKPNQTQIHSIHHFQICLLSSANPQWHLILSDPRNGPFCSMIALWAPARQLISIANSSVLGSVPLKSIQTIKPE